MNVVEDWLDKVKKEQIYLYLVDVLVVFSILFVALSLEFYSRGILNADSAELIANRTLVGALSYALIIRIGKSIFGFLGNLVGMFSTEKEIIRRRPQDYLSDIFITLGFILVTEPIRPVLQKVYLNPINPNYTFAHVYFDAIPSVIIMSLVGIPLLITIFKNSEVKIPWFSLLSVVAAIVFVGVYNNKPNYDARLYEARGNWIKRDWEEQGKTAKMALEDAETDADRAVAYYWLGVSENRMGNYEEAAEYQLKAIEANPDYGAPHSSLALAYSNLGRTQEMKRHVDECIRLSPQYAWCYYAEFAYHVNIRDYDAAFKSISKARRLDPNSPDLTREYEEFIEYYEKVTGSKVY